MATTIQTIEVPKKARALDTSGNNNHGQIYSGRGLEFDGVADYIHTPFDGNPGNFGNQSDFETTIAFWVKVNTHTGGAGLMQWASTGEVADSTPFVLLALNTTAGTSRLYVDGDYRNLTHPLQVDTWYRLVITRTASDNTWRVYVNGVADVTYDDSGTPNAQDSAVSFYLGTGYNKYFSGAFSNAQVWNKAFTQADVTYDYLNPESLALNGGGTALTESNLKLWYPMQDGHRGQQSYILDGANTGIVSYVVNEDFSTGTSGYAVSTSPDRGAITNPDGILRLTYGASYSGGNALLGPSVLVVGTTYRVKFRAKGTHATDFGSVGNNNNAQVSEITNPVLTTDWQDYEFLVTANSTLLRFYQGTYGSGETILDVDNITVQPINDKNHATTVFYGDELVTNGDMEVTDPTTIVIGAEAAAAADGTMDDSTAITAYAGSKSLAITGDSSSQYPRVQWLDGSDMGLVAGRTYYIECRVWLPSTAPNIDKVQLVVTLQSGAVYSSTANTDAWKKLSHTFVDDDITDIQIVGLEDGASAKDLTGDTFYVDSLTIKEVGVASGWTDADQQLHIPQTALQSYNELAWFDGTIASNGYVDLDSGITTSGNSWSLSFWVFHDDNGQAFDIIFGDGANQFIALRDRKSVV